MSLDEEEEEEWNQGVEEHGEFAYEDYVFPRRKMRREAEADAMVDILDDDAARADAFAGKHCPICLGKIDDSSSVIESCKHIYCTSCLFEWLQVSDRCPLCKTIVSRVLYDIKSPRDYKTHSHVRGGGGNPEGSAAAPSVAARTSLPGEQGEAAGGSRSGVARRAEFRSLVYRRGLVVEPPEDKARRPKSMDQLRPWIAREIQAAVPSGGSSSSDNGARGSERAQLVVDLVEALLKSHDVDNQEGYCTVKEQLQGFLFENTAPFLHELWCFRWSRARMPAYDRDAVYSSPRPPPRR